MRTVTLREALVPRNEIVHPRDNPLGDGIFVGLEHIEPNTGRRIGSLPIRLETMTGRKARFYMGDVVYGYLRPYLNKVWVAEFDGFCSVDQYVFKAADGYDASYLGAFLRSPQFLTRAPIHQTPGQLPRIRIEEVLSVTTVAPSIESQRSVAAKLVATTSSAQRANESANSARSTASRLKQDVLDRANSRAAESGHVAIRRLGPLFDGDWILTADYASTGVRLLQVGDVGIDAITIKSQRYVSEETAARLGCTMLHTGDILISRMAEPMGRAAILPDLGYPAITAVDVSIFRPDPDRTDRDFVALMMRSGEWYRAVESRASGATRPRISRKNLEALTLPAPPLAEQRRIAAELRERLASIDAMTRAIDDQRAAIDVLPAALLRRAFAEIEAA